ncbi:ATP-dependent DNA helicase pif1 [Eumeta japonica]|uniref:ATP-dependent DNA helicase n=1 Tax=Eumeta variegata TaxID=151549 RepID=A0A4C1VFG4_EUMVA|nr:ATP-dependent DNA helicase pif1 [Eumeta japonica]
MGHLPAERTNLEFPFFDTGADYAGPIMIAERKGRGCKSIKTYISIFVCLANRDVHLELVSDLTKEAFISALNRLTVRRGKPSNIFSDNGTSFVGAFNELSNILKQDFSSHFTVDAPCGTGKTFLINLILAEFRANKVIVLVLASSGIAPTVMDGGRIAHSAFKLPLNIADYELPVGDITKSSAREQILKQCKAITWDESTIAHRKSLEAFNRILQDLRDNTNVMEGVLLMLQATFVKRYPSFRNQCRRMKLTFA